MLPTVSSRWPWSAPSPRQARWPHLHNSVSGNHYRHYSSRIETSTWQITEITGNCYWMEDQKVCTRRDMESLVGIIQHACYVIPSGKSFLQRAISLLCSVKCHHHHIRLHSDFRSDMLWWLGFSRAKNGSSLIIHNDSRQCAITSDASGSWGRGAWYGTHWWQVQWETNIRHLHIAAKELNPILIASVVWGHHWKGANVTSHCDNTTAVSVLNSYHSKEKTLS